MPFAHAMILAFEQLREYEAAKEQADYITDMGKLLYPKAHAKI